MREKRDINIINHIISHCDEINYIVNRLGDSFDALKVDRIYKPAVSMHVVQIGGLSVHLTDEFKLNHSEIPWKKTAHNVGRPPLPRQMKCLILLFHRKLKT